MSTYKITGHHKVAGVEPGGTVHSEDLAGANIEALVTAGHLASPQSKKANKATEDDA